MLPLPIDEVLGDVVAALRHASALVLRAPPGAGKTTRVPPAILDARPGLQWERSSCCSRGASRPGPVRRGLPPSAAALGDEIGYQVRFESRVSRARESQSSPKAFCCGGCWTIRSCRMSRPSSSTNFTSARWPAIWRWRWSGRSSRSVRPELKIVVMSATLAAEPIARYLGDCPVVESRGRTFPVEVRYLPHLDRRPLVDLVAEGVEPMLDQTAGDCLVFLPGVGEIRQCEKRLAPLWLAARTSRCLQLYGDLPAEQQDAVLAAQPSGAR